MKEEPFICASEETQEGTDGRRNLHKHFFCTPGTYKIPTANDIPLDLRVTLLRDAKCMRTPQVHSSKAVGEPPLFLGASVFFALKVLSPVYLKWLEGPRLAVGWRGRRVLVAESFDVKPALF